MNSEIEVKSILTPELGLSGFWKITFSLVWFYFGMSYPPPPHTHFQKMLRACIYSVLIFFLLLLN